MTLFWQAQAPVPVNYHVALRLVSAGGQEWWRASNHPVNGMYPMAAWKPGEIVADWHEAPIGKAFPPGRYTLEVGLFPPFSHEGLSWNNPTTDGRTGTSTQGQWAPLIPLTVTSAPSAPSPRNRLRAVTPGGLELLGYDLPRQAAPMGRAKLTLYWRSLAPSPTADAESVQIGTRVIAVTTDRPSNSSEQSRGTSSDGWTVSPWTWTVPGKCEYPTTSWTPGTIVLTEHLLTMPPQEGQAVVQIALKGDKPISFYPHWLAPKTKELSLPPIQVAGRPPVALGTTNFGDRILLLDNDLGQQTLTPGAPLELTLYWQGIQPMEDNYTLFVQILAPDGTLKGQIDVWPKDGTHPTSQWRVGEAFEDRYLVYLDLDAPPGDYQVQIGWYLLETMQRLPVLNVQGQAIDDKVLLSGLTVK
jgi:hypothetical protein